MRVCAVPRSIHRYFQNGWVIVERSSSFVLFFLSLTVMKLKCINYLLKLQDIETSNKMRVNITIAILIKDHWDEMKNIRIVKVSNNWPIIETWCIDRDKPHALDSNNWKKRRTTRKICWCIDPRRFQSSCFSHCSQMLFSDGHAARSWWSTYKLHSRFAIFYARRAKHQCLVKKWQMDKHIKGQSVTKNPLMQESLWHMVDKKQRMLSKMLTIFALSWQRLIKNPYFFWMNLLKLFKRETSII